MIYNKKEFLSLPNILSYIRILLIPVIVYFYLVKENYTVSAVIAALSGITDLADGFIARKFNATTNIGKILDPIADKLTYATAFFCMCAEGKIPLFFVIGFTVIQLLQAAGAIFVYKTKNTVVMSNIPGKIAGFSMFALCILNLVFYDIIGNADLINIISFFVLAILVCASSVYFIQYIDIKHTKHINTNN